MHFVIAGAGPAGAYLAYLLRHEVRSGNLDLTVYDKRTKRELGEKCACGTHIPKLRSMLGKQDNQMIDETIFFDGHGTEVDVNSGKYHTKMDLEGLATFDKGKFIYNLLEASGAEILLGTKVERHKTKGDYSPNVLNDADMVIDATGATRALLGKPKTDNRSLMGCYSYLCQKNREKQPMWKPQFKLKTVGTGYIWEFPWCEDTIHIGCGSFDENPRHAVERYIENNNYVTITSGEGAVVDLSSPYNMEPYFTYVPNYTVGIGESIGTVSPISGEGILPSMESAAILYNMMMKYRIFNHGLTAHSFQLYYDYSNRIQEHFKSFRTEHKVKEALEERKILKGVYNGAKLPEDDVLKGSLWQRLRVITNGIKESKRKYGGK